MAVKKCVDLVYIIVFNNTRLRDRLFINSIFIKLVQRSAGALCKQSKWIGVYHCLETIIFNIYNTPLLVKYFTVKLEHDLDPRCKISPFSFNFRKKQYNRVVV